MKFLNLIRQNGATATAKYPDMTTTILFQEILHVFKKFHMTTLVTGNGNALYIFLYGRFYNLLHRPVMAKVDDLGAFALHNAAHNINCSIMTVK